MPCTQYDTFLALQPCEAESCGHHLASLSPNESNRAFSSTREVGIRPLVRNLKLDLMVITGLKRSGMTPTFPLHLYLALMHIAIKPRDIWEIF